MTNENPIIPAIAKLPLGATLEIFTDGASKNNPGPAGYGLVAVHGGVVVHQQAESLGVVTNVVAEMTAATEALRLLQGRQDIVATVITDNQMLQRGMTEWLPGWKAKGGRKADGKRVLNWHLWETLDALAARLPNVKWRWVRGHDGNAFNEIADKLASDAAERSREVA